jgi:NADH-quinone oxidoreductase subunit G
VFRPGHERRPAWVWLLACLKELERDDVAALHHFDDITRACADRIPSLAGIDAAAPALQFSNAGVRIPRQTPRYSGRTAMHADISMHEPRQPTDEESPLGYTMEGLNRDTPGSLLPWVWSPGWNSNQSVHKFQAEVGGALRGGTSGVRLLSSGGVTGIREDAAPEPLEAAPGHWLLVPRQRIFGSDELSALSPGIEALVEPASIELRAVDAASLGVSDGDGLVVGDGLATLEVRVNDTVAAGCAAYSQGLPGCHALTPLSQVTLRRDESWRRRAPPLIGSDREERGHV